ncbi:MAG TPA: hypothetical protein EYG19_08665, partial [Verrucomicrobia bacterium]|nr:hypothetical protein [Verrucomicrobiota bacterium]
MRAFSIFLLWFTLCADANDWPQWRFGPGRGAVSPHALPAELHLQWTRQLPKAAPAWPASQTKLQFDRAPEPVAADGKIFVPSTANDTLSAYDTKTGKELWRFFAEAPIRFAPVAVKGRVWFGSDDGHLYCLNAADGSLRWKFNGGPAKRWVIGNERLVSTWPSRGGPVYRDGKIWFTASIWPFMGIFIHCLDAETGRVIWTNSGDGMNYTVQPHGAPSFATVAPQGHLALAGEHLIVPGGRSTPAVYDAATGKLLHFKYDKKRGHYRVMAGGDFYFVDGGRFRNSSGNARGSIRPQLVGPDFVLTANGAKLTAETLAVKVTRKEVTDRKGKKTVQTEFKTDKLWSGELPGGFSRVFLQAGQQIVAGGKNAIGVFNIADLRKGKAEPTAQAKLKGEPWTVLAADDRLFVVTLDGRLHCFGIEQTEARHHPIPPRAKLPVNPTAAARVKSWIRSSENMQGHGLILGGTDFGTIHELLRQTQMRLTVVEANAAKAASLRELLTASGYYGERVTVHHHANPLTFSAPPHFANLVMVRGMTAHNLTEKSLINIFQSVRPYGGVLCAENAPTALIKTELAGAEIQWGGNNDVRIIRAGALPGAADWSHQYGDAGQSVVSKDQLVKAPLGLLWFGGPPNDKILPRHGHGPSPQVAGGRLFIEGADMIRAVDVYTGRLLWERELKGVGEYYNITGHFPGAGEIGSNYVSLPDAVYVVYGKTILELDAATGMTRREFKPPAGAANFGWLSVWENFLVTAAAPVAILPPKGKKELPGTKVEQLLARYASGSRILAVFDRTTGKQLWTRTAQFNFRHNNIALGGGKVFTIDSLTDAKIKALARRGIALPGKPALFALDIKTGAIAWQTDQKIFGTFLNYSTTHDLLLQAGSAYRDRAGDEVGKGMTALRGRNGKVLWENRDDSYNGPCLLMKDKIITNGNGGFAIDIKTGQPTGWKYKRNYGCNTAIGSEHLLTFRSGAAGFYDLTNDGGTGNWGGFRSSCTANLIPANGILNAPDYTRTCACAYQMQTSLALIHMPELEYWTFGATAKPGQLAINLGAPGDRRAPDGKLWVEHPNVGGNSAAAPITIEPANATPFRLHSSTVKGDGLKWVAASGLRGVKTVKLKLEKKGTYRVRLHFLEPDKLPARARQFDIVINGQTVQRQFDITASAGAPRRAVVREFKVVTSNGTIQIDLRPATDLPPILSGIEWSP